MDKIAAEKIAQEYYELGVKLAMEKLSNSPSVLRKILGEAVNRPVQAISGATGAGLGMLGGSFSADVIKPLLGLAERGSAEGLSGAIIDTALVGGGAGLGALAGLKNAPKLIRTPELVFQPPGIIRDGGFRLR